MGGSHCFGIGEIVDVILLGVGFAVLGLSVIDGEALAEGYFQLRVHGLGNAIRALRFPLTGGYVTISELVAEGQTIGTIVVGGIQLRVSDSRGTIPSSTHD